MLTKLLATPAAARAFAYGLLAALGTSIDGVLDIDIPDVHGTIEHTLVGIAVAALVWANSEG